MGWIGRSIQSNKIWTALWTQRHKRRNWFRTLSHLAVYRQIVEDQNVTENDYIGVKMTLYSIQIYHQNNRAS